MRGGLCVSLIILCGLAFAGCQASSTESEMYVELRQGDGDSVQVVIFANQWGGLFTVHGLGPGIVQNLHYWVTLNGPGPIYRNPKLYQNGRAQYEHVGTITVDRSAKRVVIDLERVISRPNAPNLLEPSPANGSYRIRRISEEPYLD